MVRQAGVPVNGLLSVRERIEILVGILLLIAMGAALGYAAGIGHGRDEIAKAAKAEGTAGADAEAARASLAELQRRFRDQAASYASAQETARKELAARDTAKAMADAKAEAATKELRNRAHAAPACADLARLPVCPVVADGLWGNAADNASTGGDH